MDKPSTGGNRNRRAREIVGSGGFTVKNQIVGKVGLRGYGALLDALARTTRPAKGRRPRGRKPVSS
jgi:hypothetical protein